ncbi:uncharacterized protein LOC121868727 [Homarus americanus]|uniref:uncharacterized protein LOC121868727 n=1 Tax=Homarus americanus TaxID=6706 RepID=UPI001C447810|nr:uncharacterized protein LOC121868727 [Homarus americanus]XP_042225524.1 uncharacterized protein LOC121868727 [Homarus americanus]
MSERMDNKLYNWASSLTHHHKVFSHDQPLTPQHFSDLTRDKNLQPVLSFLIRHVRPPEERRLIKLNLKHARFRKHLREDERELLPSEEIFRLKAAIVETRATLAAEVKEIQQLSQKKEELHQRRVEVQRRIMLLKVVQEEREREIHHCQLWNSQLCNLAETISSKKGQKTSRTDMALQQQLRGSLLDLEKFHHSIITGRLMSPDYIHQQKLCLWEHIGNSVEDWDPRMLLDVMLSEVREGTRSLHSRVQYVDLARDARELRLKCESDGSFIDEMNPGGVIESVRELLGQMSAAHVKLYVEAHRADQAASSLTRALNTLNKNISAVAKRTYCDEAVAAAVIDVVNANIAVVGERAALNAAHTLTASLQERADTAARARDALRAKHAKIMSFEKEVQDRVESIQCLATSVRGGWPSIKDQLVQLKYSINKTLSSTIYPTPVSPNSLGNECEAFTAVPLAYLLTTNIDGSELRQKAKMSTCSLVWYDTAVAEAGWKAVSQLGSGLHCWDGIYNTVCEQLNLTNYFHNQIGRLETVREAIHSAQKNTQFLTGQEMKELINRVEESDRKLHEEVSQQTENLQQKLAEGFQSLTVVNKIFSDWWEQPAKFIKLKQTCNS